MQALELSCLGTAWKSHFMGSWPRGPGAQERESRGWRGPALGSWGYFMTRPEVWVRLSLHQPLIHV